MATKTFTQLTAYASTLAADDEVVLWDTSAAAPRKMTMANFIANSPNGGLAEKGAANAFTALIKADSSDTGTSVISMLRIEGDANGGGGQIYTPALDFSTLNGNVNARMYAQRESGYGGSLFLQYQTTGGTLTDGVHLKYNGHVLIGTASDDGIINFGTSTARLALVDATGTGSTKSTPGTVNGWAEIKIGGVTHYIPAYTSKTS